MTFEITQAGWATTKTYKTDYTTTFWCKDFTIGTCCEECHKKEQFIAIWPWSHAARVPDLSLGLKAEVCCGRFHAVRDLSRAWWIQIYGKKSGWSAADIQKILQATPEAYLKTVSEVAARYYRSSPGYTPIKSYSKPVAARSSGVVKKRGCPKCGSTWDGVACDSCGHS